MKIVITADWQVCYENLDEAKTAWKFLCKLANEKGLEAIVIAGDLKHVYNPIDQRVIKFWDRAIEDAIQWFGLRVIILLGNHDREGLYSDSKNWLFILRRSGAEVFDKPGICEMKDGKLAMLPFTTRSKLLRERAAKLANNKWNKFRDVLIFHNDIKECSYDIRGTKSRAKISINELHPEKYLTCIGGHIHLPQDYFVGSPFATDWGEANQQKRFLIVDGHRIHSVKSPIPGWYDETLPKFFKPDSWKGAHLRVHVKIEAGENAAKICDNARKIAEREYQGAIVKVKPEFIDGSNDKILSIDDKDEKKIRDYVDETLPSKLTKYRDRAISFLTNKLAQVKGLRRSGHTLKFISVKGKNILSFKDINCNFRKQGLVLIEGENRDWSNQSNGAGKTNYVQMIPVSLCGMTFKGQKADKWARRYTKDKASISLKMEDGNGRIVEIKRTRRPVRVQLFINGHDNSSGINRAEENNTQERLESITGFTRQVLTNSLYIDKTAANAFLSGRKSDRIDLLYKFQNLERFEKALKLIKKYETRHQKAIEQTEQAIDTFSINLKTLKKSFEDTKQDFQESIIDKIRKAYKERLKIWKELHSKKLKLERHANHIEIRYKKKYDASAKLSVDLDKQIEKLGNILWADEQELQKFKNILSKDKCPTCGQDIKHKDHSHEMKEIAHRLNHNQDKVIELKAKLFKANEKCALYEGEIDKASIEAAAAKTKADVEKNNIRSIKQQLKQYSSNSVEATKRYEAKYKKVKQDLHDFKDYLEDLVKEKKFIQYCEEAFSKNGLPAYLNNQLCPVLNHSTEYYSDLFCDKEISVKFNVEDGDLVPEIINLHGGNERNDQSVGEAAIAGLITSFALKDIATKTNVLILDEPTDGLSPVNISKFAKGLLKLKDRFETIFVVTHNPIFQSELQKDKIIKIIKHKRVSRVIL